MAEANRSKSTTTKPYWWGELIEGTAEGIQSLGIGCAMAFPGEPGGPKRQLNVRDPRGFRTRIERSGHGDTYSAYIDFPGRAFLHESKWMAIAPGVRKRVWCWTDAYTGTAAALHAAGLVRIEQLPGQPGMRKVTVRIRPDGTIPQGPPTSPDVEGVRDAGAKEITRCSKSTYVVSIYVTEAEHERRSAAGQRAFLEHEARMNALPRPAPLRARVRSDAEMRLARDAATRAGKDGAFQRFLARIEGGNVIPFRPRGPAA